MRKTFIVEIDYEELPENMANNAEVLYEAALESFIEDVMFGYKTTGSIQGDYEVEVKQV